MRRADREMTDPGATEDVLRRALVCRLGLCDEGQPYIVPVCFGVADGHVYVHCAPLGRKLDIIRRNPRACVEFEVDVELVPARSPCQWGMRYRSVIGFGHATLVAEPAERRRALDAIVAHYGGRNASMGGADVPDDLVVLRIDIHEMTGKQSGYSPDSYPLS